MKETYGFDLDGVLAIEIAKRNIFYMNEYYESCIPYRLDKSFSPYHIITGRKKRFRKVTEKWLKDNNFSYLSIHFFEHKKKSFENLANHKIDVIKKLGVTMFFEDTPEIACRIKRDVPDCRVIVLFDNGTFEIINL